MAAAATHLHLPLLLLPSSPSSPSSPPPTPLRLRFLLLPSPPRLHFHLRRQHRRFLFASASSLQDFPGDAAAASAASGFQDSAAAAISCFQEFQESAAAAATTSGLTESAEDAAAAATSSGLTESAADAAAATTSGLTESAADAAAAANFQESPSGDADADAIGKKGGGQLRKRVVVGVGIGIGAGGVVVAGGWVFAAAMAAVVLIGAREYFELVRSRGLADGGGMPPPPRYVSRVCSAICAFMPILTLYYGHMDVAVTFSAFLIAIALILQRGNPRFAQLTSAVFGLFYCGYLPCFWVKLRSGIAAPALNTKIGNNWPILLGGQAHWTVGLVATLISISSIIAADSCAFLCGQAFGRTPLTNISPKKTLEGAIAGLTGCILTSVLLSTILSWPKSLLSAMAYGILNFVGSLFGDLVESLIKRDAGVKDSGSLIPGHGGILDRVDSYVFTGALCYSFVKVALPLFGV